MRDFRDQSGIYRATSGSYGFFTPDDGGEDLFVPPKEEVSAWDGDRVMVRPIPSDSNGQRGAVRVIKIIERAHSFVTGTLSREHRHFFLHPSNLKLPSPILVTGGTHNAHAGDRVAISMQSYAHDHGQMPSGRLEEIFGPSTEFYSIIEAILFDHGITAEFPTEVLEQVSAVPDAPVESDLDGRLDLRSKPIITIDGASTRDFDDAVSLERCSDGNWELGVHIADVSHYVPLGSPLDLSALERGTSVYFADRVIPMLPVVLSNGICSLNPGVDRLTLSCLMKLDNQGNVISHSIKKSVVRSIERMTYEDCNTMLSEDAPELRARYSHILPLLEDMEQLARLLKEKRTLRGSLTLESQELSVLCDENGEPVGLSPRRQGRSESIIEEFMLVANETVAKHLCDAGMPAIFRIHEPPSSDKLDILRTALSPLGYQVGQGDSFALQKVVDEAHEKPEALMINTLILRAQKKARYDRENLSHFALAAPWYCHFTSPIRRYPDLMVHRALTALLTEEKNGKTAQTLKSLVDEAARKSSLREQAAAEAEREIEKRYAARYLAAHIGEVFPGAVSGATRFGLFVLLSCGAEGRLGLEYLPPAPYEYHEETITLTGGGTSYTIGTPLTVKVLSADVESGQVELALEGSSFTPQSTDFRFDRAPNGKSRSQKDLPHHKKGHSSFRPPRKKPGGRKGRR